MRAGVRRVLLPLLLVGLALLAAAPVRGNKEFDRLVRHVEQQLGTAKTDIPCGWLVGLALRFTKPEGSGDFSSPCSKTCPEKQRPDSANWRAGARACLGPGWAAWSWRCPARSS